jgi:hypothetical protein
MSLQLLGAFSRIGQNFIQNGHVSQIEQLKAMNSYSALCQLVKSRLLFC